MEVAELEQKIYQLLSQNEMTTDDIEASMDKKSLEECSDKIIYALIRLKNANKIENRFEGKKNFWRLTDKEKAKQKK